MSCKVMIVDDDVIIRSLFEKSFCDSCQLVIAAEGATALEMIKKDKPDLLFLDIDMPGISGMEVLRLLKASGTMPIIWMLTGNEKLEIITEAINLGAAGYLTKPFDQKKIKEILDNVLTPEAEKTSARPWSVKRKGGQEPEKPGQKNQP
ncbi:MAG: hypothetical protein A2016_00555 [Elusimicrobia bacterium GWF2_62_30]|nr:MAG: hypothetical protein A2016_00555 [Elusimicrobia bacterium GWF2_62_30]